MLTGALSVSIRGDSKTSFPDRRFWFLWTVEFCGAQNDQLSKTSTCLPAFASVQHDVRWRDGFRSYNDSEMNMCVARQ